MNTLFPIEREICNRLDETARELYPKEVNDSVWTVQFKQSLFDLARENDLQPWGTGAGEDCPEWLWDVCWAKLGRNRAGKYDWKDFRGVYLACEIEWRHDDANLLNDFLKLVVARADYRLFVFGCSKEQDAEEKFEMLIRHCPVSGGARYLALAVPDKHPAKYLPKKAWTL